MNIVERVKNIIMRRQIGWGIKNIFELKNARRVIVRGNIFEHNWPDAQSGWTITITVRANSTSAPWTTIQHVLFESNIVRHASAGFNILGLDNQVPSAGQPVYPSTPMDDVVIRNNLVYDIDRWVWTGPRPQNVGNGVFMVQAMRISTSRPAALVASACDRTRTRASV